MSDQAQVGLAFLDKLERQEAELLSWGMVDGFFDVQELENLATDFLDELAAGSGSQAFASSDELSDWLEDQNLLWCIPNSGGDKWRTRMAEGVRLISRLRQLLNPTGWQQAANLVADFRFHLQPREFPRRSIHPDQVIRELNAQSSLTQLQKKVISAYLQADTETPMQLSEFQVRASKRILSSAEKRRFGATIVCAGTGSGKTLAFFLPTLVHLAKRPNRGKAVPCLALYPRKELLKDQFRAAIGELLKIKSAFDSERQRPLSIGTFYGDTPEDADLTSIEWAKWGRFNGPRGPAFICPFARCSECGNDMVWDEEDVKRKQEILRCSQCELELGPELIRLTRSELLVSPPDVLFTTTEMLNQRMSSDKFRGLFGIGVSDSPQIMLLDEVHTYDGVHGAQVGNLIRRWRHLSGAHPHFVGLSATLADAVRFMADLTGIYQVNVEEVKPLPEDMTREGMEYLLALRGDAVSGKSLLSTSIQTAFLLSRLMEPMHLDGQEVKAYGKKVFAFTDDLDVTNRLYHSLLDAEGWARVNSPNNRQFGALANLRAAHRDDHAFRLDDGQSWDLVETIGHSLQDGQRSGVGRVSSQDSGVDQSASVIVATASLEVGYDDPEVGAVIQHKAPRNAASFVQRKGRAGRGREMRPWTTIVLSDYGQDRAAFLGYDRLFSPVVPPRYLPVKNRFVLRIQATYALMDWLADQTPRDPHREIRRALSQPANESKKYANLERKRQNIFSQKVQKLLTDTNERSKFTQFVSLSLDIELEVANALLWDPPRALMTAVLPTLQRRLDDQWKNADGSREHYRRNAPLPEFIPKTLFDDLNLPEVEMVLGQAQSRSNESMPIIQSLKEFAPGRVSKRFQISDSRDAYWIAPPNEDSECELLVNSFLRPEDTQELGVFRYWGEQGWIDIPALRPHAITTERPPLNIGGTSNAFPIWRTQLVPGDAPHQIDLPIQSSWNTVFSGIEFHLHSLGNPLEMRRFTLGSEASVRKNQGRDNFDQEIRFVREDEEGDTTPVALGFASDVDAILFKITLPKTLKDHCIRDPQLLRGLRTSFFKYRLQKNSDLPRRVNKFQRDWLADIYLAAITHEAVTKEIGLSEAATALEEGRASLPLDEVLSVVFQTVTEAGDEEEEARITGQLRRLITDPAILSVIQAAAKTLWEQPDTIWEVWLRSRLRETLGAALHSACTRFCDQIDVGDLVVDLDPGPSPSGEPSLSDLEDDIWLTESTIGGSGFAEIVLEKLGEDPNRFLQYLEAELEPSDAEEVDYSLNLLLNYLDPGSSDADENIQQSVRSLRDPGTQANASKEYKHLRSLLIKKGVTVNRPLGTSLNLRILRPGSTPSTDQVLRDLLSRWEKAEERLGIEIDLRVFAYTCTTDQSFDRAFGHLGRLPQESNARLAWRFNALISMLWPRGAVLRREALSYYNRFADPPQCDRLLLKAIQPNPLSAVSVMDQNWREKLREILLQDGQAELFAKLDEKSELRAAIVNLMVEEMDTGFLLTCPRVVGTRSDRELIRITLDLPEAVR